MRIWSLHPRYLDPVGIVALWRETLLAKKVLSGNTTGYRNHPQLYRFKSCAYPTDAIEHYLSWVYREALSRGYNFDRSKVNWDFKPVRLEVSNGQMAYERVHLLNKLNKRNKKFNLELLKEKEVVPHPMFDTVPGAVASWEIH